MFRTTLPSTIPYNFNVFIIIKTINKNLTSQNAKLSTRVPTNIAPTQRQNYYTETECYYIRIRSSRPVPPSRLDPVAGKEPVDTGSGGLDGDAESRRHSDSRIYLYKPTSNTPLPARLCYSVCYAMLLSLLCAGDRPSFASESNATQIHPNFTQTMFIFTKYRRHARRPT